MAQDSTVGYRDRIAYYHSKSGVPKETSHRTVCTTPFKEQRKLTLPGTGEVGGSAVQMSKSTESLV